MASVIMSEGVTVKKKKAQTEFTCETCGKVYKTKKYFKNHTATHTPPGEADGAHHPEPPLNPQPSTSGDNSLVSAECELPPNYEWDEWCEDNENEEPSYFELQDEEEEARRAAAMSGGNNAAASKKQKKKAFLIKCHECASKFNSLDNYIRHRAGHGMKAAYMKAPTLEKIIEASPELLKPLLEVLEKCPLTGGQAPTVASIAGRLKEKMNSELMPTFCKTLCEGLCSDFLKKKDFLSPSQLAVAFLQNSSAFISNISERLLLQELLCDVLGTKEEIRDLNMFLPYFMRKFSDKVLVFILRTLRLGDGSATVLSLHERYAKTSQSTDTTDFVQSLHYIGGSNIKSVLRTAMKYNSAEWKRVTITLRKFFLVSDFAMAPPQELSAWTEIRDRGGLQKISSKALEFFVILGKEVKPLERLDGSLLNEEVFDAIGQCAPLLCLWDELKGDLSDPESCKLLHALVSHFCYTWRNGVVSRRHDAVALSKSEKHGTGGVAFRPRLIGNSGKKGKE